MLVEMDQIEFVGDLSLSDAKELARLGSEANSILEFGAGGSTQILAQCCPKIFVSIDTDRAWIKRTSENLKKISHERWTVPWFDNYPYTPDQFFDLIFVDGHPSKRLDFAMRAISSELMAYEGMEYAEAAARKLGEVLLADNVFISRYDQAAPDRFETLVAIEDGILRENRRINEPAELRLAPQHLLRLGPQPVQKRVEIDDGRGCSARVGGHGFLLRRLI